MDSNHTHIKFYTLWQHDRSWDYYAGRNKSDSKFENYVISLLCWYKSESNKETWLIETHGHGQWISGYQREEGWGEVGKGNRGQVFGDRRKSNFGWRTHTAIYVWHTVVLYT